MTGRVPWYPTQAKVRLEWGTQHLLPVKQERNYNRKKSFGCPIQAALWLEWDTTAPSFLRVEISLPEIQAKHVPDLVYVFRFATIRLVHPVRPYSGETSGLDL
jgi:hypothetical protein